MAAFKIFPAASLTLLLLGSTTVLVPANSGGKDAVEDSDPLIMELNKKEEDLAATDIAVAAAEEDPVFRRFNELRAQGLKEWENFLASDHLAGFAEARVVESVCGNIRSHEERQMCRKRGRRIGETLLKHYPTPLTARGARSAQMGSPMKYVTRVVIKKGKILGWNWGRGRRPYRDGVEKLKMAFVLARLVGLLRQGKMHHNQTVTLLIQNDDKCNSRKLAYPVTWFATGKNCPHVVPLTGNYLQQVSGFTPTVPVKPFEDLTNKVFFRATGYNEHRWDAFLLSGSGLLPWLDTKQVKTSSYAAPYMKLCEKSVKQLHALKPTIYNGTPFPNDRQCGKGPGYKHSAHSPPVSFDKTTSHKYMLLIDGFVSCYRLAAQLQAPGVTMLVQQSETAMSYSQDLIPYVHYLPISHDRKMFPDSIKATYEWAEKYADVTKSIAAESTRWSRLHAESKAHDTDWELYVAFLAHMTDPDPQDATFAESKLEFSPGPCPRPAEMEKFFGQSSSPFDDQVPSSMRQLVYNLACRDAV